MDRPQERDYAYKFRRVEIFKNQELGHGSYGAVYKAKCDSLPCAAKLIYPVLFGSEVQSSKDAQQQDREHRKPMMRFEAECSFLSQIKHPNIVQYLGTYHEPDTNAPVLLMELMDESLTHFLEVSQTSLMFHIQLNILHDTTLALAFLHSNGIIHRDMSSNNVLLIAGRRAKVTDFGMSTLTDAATSYLASLTQCPGTPPYMSPEALDEPPVYTEKLDCFSLGVLIIQVITRMFPKPTDRFESRELLDPLQPTRRLQAKVPIPEVKRRREHINLVPTSHPLLQIAINCLGKTEDRPSTLELCDSLEELKASHLYTSSIVQAQDCGYTLEMLRQTIEERVKEIQDKDQLIEDKDQQNVRQHERLQSMQYEIQQLKKEVELKDQRILELQRGIQTKQNSHSQAQTQHLNLSIESQKKGPATGRKSTDFILAHDQMQHLNLCVESQNKTEVRKKAADFTLTSTKGPRTPAMMSRGSITVIENIAYFNSPYTRDVYTFHCRTFQWLLLPTCPYKSFTLVSINNRITTVGGQDPNPPHFTPTAKLLTYRKQKWVREYPPMNTRRYNTAAVSTSTHVVVIKGVGDNRLCLRTTEVLDLNTRQWSMLDQFSYGFSLASTTVCGDTLYMLGFGIYSGKDFSVHCCSLNDLVESATLPEARASKVKVSFPSTTTDPEVWHKLPNLPVELSTCVTVNGELIAIGGRDVNNKTTNSIYKYDRNLNMWIVLGCMSTPRSSCLAAVLPSNDLLVVGGFTPSGKTNETEIFKVTEI